MPSAAIASCTIRTARSRSSSGYRRWLGCFFCSTWNSPFQAEESEDGFPSMKRSRVGTGQGCAGVTMFATGQDSRTMGGFYSLHVGCRVAPRARSGTRAPTPN